jgi:outer membrane murein-binding lipoprotein Lpp
LEGLILKIRAALLVAVSIVVGACAPRSEVDKAQTEAKELAAKVGWLERQNDEQRKRITELEAAAAQQSAKLASAQQQLDRKPAIPVKVRLRPALLGGGYVAVFSTTIKQDFPILVTVKSKALGTSKQYRVNMSSTGTTEMGTSDGFNVDPDDELLLENTNYESARLSFKK